MLCSQSLVRVSSYKYLGVIISDNFSWSLHIIIITDNMYTIIHLQRYHYGIHFLKQLFVLLLFCHLNVLSINNYVTDHNYLSTEKGMHSALVYQILYNWLF